MPFGLKGMDPPKKVAFYIRVSTERQARVEEGSLKNQEQMLRAELERRNAQRPDWGVFVESYVDEGISAKTTNRPAFQRLMRDIELGKIDTVLFTELSRLSRSLKDFLNIFEFAQRHACDLVCLKTEIDTTSPYQGLVTKILMVFSEFEREMTSRRTAINAYERSKRGLANGGQTLLGYRRDPAHKGRLLVEETEAEVVRAIFQTYALEKSIRRATEQIKARYEGRLPRLKRITSNMVYRVLTNRAYLGIRAIHKRDKASYEEVSAAWEPILEESLFRQVQALLQANKDRYHRRGPQRYLYLLSGLLACGKCGEKLQGKSAYSSHDKRYHYYAHRSTCANHGRNGIDAEVAQGLVLGWLHDIAESGERFRELQAQGRERIGRQIDELRESMNGLESEGAALKEQVELRIQELTRTRAEAVRDSIEKSITDIGQRQKEIDEKRLFADHAARELGSILENDADLFTAYSRQIQKVLDGPAEGLKAGLHGLIASLLLMDTEIKLALSGGPLREPVRAVLVPSPRVEQNANQKPDLPSLIEGSIPLLGLTLLRNKSYLAQLYDGRHLSARQIARLTKTNRSVVLAALSRCSVAKSGRNRTHPGQLPFGYDYLHYRLVENQAEQGVIRLMGQARAAGLSLRQIAGQLNERLVPSKDGGTWQANTVRLILARA